MSVSALVLSYSEAAMLKRISSYSPAYFQRSGVAMLLSENAKTSIELT